MHIALPVLVALLPAMALLGVLWQSDKNREPPVWILGTFALGLVGALVESFIEARVMGWTQIGPADGASYGVMLFCLIAPLREVSKVIATWPAFRSAHFDEPYDGIVYSGSAALGFAAFESGLFLFRQGVDKTSVVRALLGIPANVFFACFWGHALGRAKQVAKPGATFPFAWVIATISHALYIYLLYARGATAIWATVPILLTMAAIAGFAARDLRKLPAFRLLQSKRLKRRQGVPTFEAVREALKKRGEPIRYSWVVFGIFVTLGAMLLGFGASVLLGTFAHVDFSTVSEKDASTAGPVALLSAGLLAAFPASGYLIAKASRMQSILEPALSSASAIVLTLVMLGVAAPIAVVVGMAFSPIAWGLSCAGAWVGRIEVGS